MTYYLKAKDSSGHDVVLKIRVHHGDIEHIEEMQTLRKPVCPRCGSDDMGQLDHLDSEDNFDYESQGGRWYCIRCGWEEELPAPKLEET